MATMFAEAQKKLDSAPAKTVDPNAANTVKQLKIPLLEYMRARNLKVYTFGPKGPWLERVDNQGDLDYNKKEFLSEMMSKMFQDAALMGRVNQTEYAHDKANICAEYLLALASGRGKKSETVKVVYTEPLLFGIQNSSLFG